MSRFALPLILVLLLSVFAQADDEVEVEVGVGVLNLRSSPNGRKLRSLSKGAKLEVIGSARDGSWLKVRVGNATGYVFKKYTRPGTKTTKPGETHTVNSRQGLNIRSSASGRAGKLGSLKSGAEVEVISTSGNWSKVQTKVNGRTVTGWVYSRYLKKKPGQSVGMAKALEGALSGGKPTTRPEEAPKSTTEAESATDPRSTSDTTARSDEAGSHQDHDHDHGGATSDQPAEGAHPGERAAPRTNGSSAAPFGSSAGRPTGERGTTAAPLSEAEAAPIPINEGATMALGKKQVNASSLNVRAEPSTSAEILGRLSRGSEVDLLELQGDWSRIRHASLTGWVASRYLGEPGSANGRVNYGRYRVSDPLVRQVLERIAQATGRTVTLTSGDRTYVPRGGSRTSLHLLRRAADFKVTGMSLGQVFDLIRNNKSSILAGAGYEVIYHQPGTNTGGPHLHVGRRGSSADSIKTERGGRYRYIN